MATLDVLSRASKDKANLVITLEPTFFGRVDGATADDPVYAAKLDFIRKNRMVVLRFNDLWRAFKPDPFATGLAGAMGWTGYQAGDNVFRYDVPAVTLAALSGDLAKRLNARAGIRVVGDPQTKVRRIALLPGLSTLADAMKNLPDCDLLLAGETREWESVEYAQDTVASGQKKGMIMLGRVLSEEPGMKVCAAWMKGLVPEVPVRWVAAGDPYWRPA
jgi:putative NIF3 family GTP cyclohydrolase 1 type 2